MVDIVQQLLGILGRFWFVIFGIKKIKRLNHNTVRFSNLERLTHHRTRDAGIALDPQRLVNSRIRQRRKHHLSAIDFLRPDLPPNVARDLHIRQRLEHLGQLEQARRGLAAHFAQLNRTLMHELEVPRVNQCPAVIRDRTDHPFLAAQTRLLEHLRDHRFVEAVLVGNNERISTEKRQQLSQCHFGVLRFCGDQHRLECASSLHVILELIGRDCLGWNRHFTVNAVYQHAVFVDCVHMFCPTIHQHHVIASSSHVRARESTDCPSADDCDFQKSLLFFAMNEN